MTTTNPFLGHFRIELWGDYALFTRPEYKSERVSYDVPTPSAIRGILCSIYVSQGMRWVVDRIHVLSPITKINIKRNEVTDKISARTVKNAITNDDTETLFLDAKEKIMQRNSQILKNVHYVVDAHFEMTEGARKTDNPRKFESIINRRINRGQCRLMPYFGCREFPAYFRLWDDDKDIPTIPDSNDFGYMLYDMDYSNPDKIVPLWYHAQMVNGVINCEEDKIVRKEEGDSSRR